jgi:zinc and cadmium transporter
MNATGSWGIALPALYGLLIVLASLAGGWLTLVIKPTHTRLQLGTSFVAGLMLGVGLLHLLPHAYHQLHSLDRAVMWVLIGFLAVFFLQRFFHFHHHDVPEEHPPEAAHTPRADGVGPEAGHEHDHTCCRHTLAEQSARRLSWSGATLGLLLHSVLDGVAVAASVQAEADGHAHGLAAGLGTFLVVLLHKPFDSMAVGALMARGESPRWSRHLVNALLALAAPAGMVLFQVGLSQSQASQLYLGAALAFSAGTFLCIAASDLLPELQFHAHDRWKLSFALLAGLVFSALIGRFETTGHDRSEGQAGEGPAATEEHRH